MRAYRRVLATFAAGETDAVYTEQLLDANGDVVKAFTGLTAFKLGGHAVMDVGVPAAVAAGVEKLQFEKAFMRTGDFYPAYDETGTLIEVPKVDGSTDVSIQTIKGGAFIVNYDMLAGYLLKLIPVDSSGDPVAPGAVTFEIGLKE